MQTPHASCWGALPRRQRRLSRSSFGSNHVSTLAIRLAGCVAVVVACLELATYW
jgi:hypothetical protein